MLSWDPSSDDGVAGYRIYFGTASHAYTDSVDVGVVSSAQVSVPSDATTFYFAATTYYGSGDESDFSNEATVVVPNVAVPPGTNALSSAATLTSLSPEDIEVEGAFGLAVIGLPGTEYVVQASTNLVDWVSVETNTSPFTFEELKMGEYSQRFFRTYTVPAAATVVALPERKFGGKIKSIGGTTGPPWDRHFDTKITIDNPAPELRPGMNVRLLITTEVMKSVLWLPAQALFEADNRKFVYAESAGSYSRKEVKLLRSSESRVVVEGLREGQLVALANPEQINSKDSAKTGGATQAIGR